jgi:hypothetical protein
MNHNFRFWSESKSGSGGWPWPEFQSWCGGFRSDYWAWSRSGSWTFGVRPDCKDGSWSVLLSMGIGLSINFK